MALQDTIRNGNHARDGFAALQVNPLAASGVAGGDVVQGVMAERVQEQVGGKERRLPGFHADAVQVRDDGGDLRAGGRGVTGFKPSPSE